MPAPFDSGPGRDDGQAVRLFVGGSVYSVRGERDDLAGDRCFSAAWRPRRGGHDPRNIHVLLDSGAFTDPPAARMTPEAALDRQLRWEATASDLWGGPFQAHALVSYDLLIDETWTTEGRRKQRWTVGAAEAAVAETVAAAAYLAGQRKRLGPRRLVLSCQGVDAIQYEECVAEILKFATPRDVIGLGGWCILGRFTRWLPVFWAAMHRVLPRIAAAGVRDVHIFGVLYRPALGGLLWLGDHYGLNISTDSTAPILSCVRADHKRAGVLAPYWRDNVRLWKEALAGLRRSPHYRRPPLVRPARQAHLFDHSLARVEEERHASREWTPAG